MEAFPGGIPTAAPLDEIAPDRPVYLPNRDGHGAWVNSKALQLPATNRHTLDRGASSVTVRTQPGRHAGGRCAAPVSPAAARADRGGPDEALRLAQEHLLAVGITGWQDAIIGRYISPGNLLPAYVRAARIVVTLGATGHRCAVVVLHRGLDQLAELIQERDLAPGWPVPRDQCQDDARRRRREPHRRHAGA